MARWLLIVLLFALPAQFAIAAAAGYCAHETAAASFHLGHHGHEHSTKDTGSMQETHSDASAEKVFFDHDDCSGCHANIAQLSAAQQTALQRTNDRLFVAIPTEFFSSRTQQDIYRPKWARIG